jgi:hypothetical protein
MTTSKRTRLASMDWPKTGPAARKAHSPRAKRASFTGKALAVRDMIFPLVRWFEEATHPCRPAAGRHMKG